VIVTVSVQETVEAERIAFVLGHARYMKAIRGGKAKNGTLPESHGLQFTYRPSMTRSPGGRYMPAAAPKKPRSRTLSAGSSDACTAAGWRGAKLANSKKMAHPQTVLCHGMATGTIVWFGRRLFGVGKALKREFTNYWS